MINLLTLFLLHTFGVHGTAKYKVRTFPNSIELIRKKQDEK